MVSFVRAQAVLAAVYALYCIIVLRDPYPWCVNVVLLWYFLGWRGVAIVYAACIEPIVVVAQFERLLCSPEL